MRAPVWLPVNGSGSPPVRLPCKKLSPRYVASFLILKQITPVSYRLQLPSEYCVLPTFHVIL